MQQRAPERKNVLSGESETLVSAGRQSRGGRGLQSRAEKAGVKGVALDVSWTSVLDMGNKSERAGEVKREEAVGGWLRKKQAGRGWR